MKEIICSGFGGQGVLTAGLLIAYAAHHDGKHITWYPSYGSEMRGGTANCMVKYSDDEISSPYVKKIDILLAYNEPSVKKFEHQVKPGGYLIANAALVDEDEEFRDDINVVKVNIEKLSKEIGNPKAANIVMLGAMLKKTDIMDVDKFEEAIRVFFEEKGKQKFHEANKAALMIGYESV